MLTPSCRQEGLWGSTGRCWGDCRKGSEGREVSGEESLREPGETRKAPDLVRLSPPFREARAARP